MSSVRELSVKVAASRFRRITILSNAMFVTGLAIIALLMPLGRLPNPPDKPPYVSIVLLPLLLQRMVLMTWDSYHHRQGGGWPSARMAVAFALPVAAAAAATMA